MATNDNKILDLKKVIETKRVENDKLSYKYSIKTTCVLDLFGTKININTLKKDQLQFLYVALNSVNRGGLDSGFPVLTISGFSIHDWIDDIKYKIDMMSKREADEELNTLERKLNDMLSEEKRTEIELGEIENLLGKKS